MLPCGLSHISHSCFHLPAQSQKEDNTLLNLSSSLPPSYAACDWSFPRSLVPCGLETTVCVEKREVAELHVLSFIHIGQNCWESLMVHQLTRFEICPRKLLLFVIEAEM